MPDAIAPAGGLWLSAAAAAAAAAAKEAFDRMCGLFGVNIEPGQYRLDSETNRYVEIIKGMWPEDNLPEGAEYQLYLVRDVLSNLDYWRKENMLWDEEAVPAMTVIAWAAQEGHEDFNISGD